MRTLVTGAGGYIGSVLVPALLDDGHDVVALDRFFFGEHRLAADDRLRIVRADVRDLPDGVMDGVDGVVDLAALSNDPSGEIDPELTRSINHEGRRIVATAARDAGVRRYVLASSCSVYGAGEQRDLDEQAPLHPLTTYAACNVAAEESVLALGDDDLAVTAMRNATVFGASPRMRFDLLVNLMTLDAATKGVVSILGGGRQVRPLVHVGDVARAVLACLRAPRDLVAGEVFNIGKVNLPVRTVAFLVRERMPFPVELVTAPDDVDSRDYHASFAKAREVLGFEAQVTVEEGIDEVYEGIRDGRLDDGVSSRTVKWYERLLEAKRLLESVELDGRLL